MQEQRINGVTGLNIGSRLFKTISMQAPGTCGELVQGYIDGQDFLINCPIDLYARAKVTPSETSGLQLELPQQFSKIRDVLTLAAQEHFMELNHYLSVKSAIPRGKGMASSTADITAALAALCSSNDMPLSNTDFARLITEVEPSDCTHFHGIAHVNHLTGDLFEILPAPKNLKVLIYDCGGEIDTIGFDRKRAREIYRREPAAIVGAVELLKRGLRSGNLQWVADAATRSAEISQNIHRKPQFEELLVLSKSLGALGVNCAHSGSVLGVLYPASEMLKEHLMLKIGVAFGTSVKFIGDHHLIGGGYYEC